MISITNYGKYSNSNYGIHTLQVNMPKITVYFSYKTIIAFHTMDEGLITCENIWTVTTGKHLNWIDNNKDSRLPYDEFQARLNAAISKIFA